MVNMASIQAFINNVKKNKILPLDKMQRYMLKPPTYRFGGLQARRKTTRSEEHHILSNRHKLNDVEHRQGTCMLAPGHTDMLSNVKFTQHGKTLEKDEIFENPIKSTLQHLTYPTDKLTSITLAHSKLHFFLFPISLKNLREVEFIFIFWKIHIPKTRCCITVANRYWHKTINPSVLLPRRPALDDTRQGHLLTTSTTAKARCHQGLANPASAMTCRNAATLPAHENVACTAVGPNRA